MFAGLISGLQGSGNWFSLLLEATGLFEEHDNRKAIRHAVTVLARFPGFASVQARTYTTYCTNSSYDATIYSNIL
jgi:hypothetical protein